MAVLTASMLEAFDFSVRRVGNAPAALAALESGHAVDLVLSDIVMPGGMSGIELARELKRRRPDLPVILATGYTNEARDGQAVEGLPVLSKTLPRMSPNSHNRVAVMRTRKGEAMPSRSFFTSKSTLRRTGDAVDVAARYFVYALYDATNGYVGAWMVLGERGSGQASVARAVERGWAIVQENGKGRKKVRSASLTDDGRRLALKSLR